MVLEVYNKNVLNRESSNVSGYDSRFDKISYQICTGQRYLPVHSLVTLEFLTLLLCIQNIEENLSTRCMRTLLCVGLRRYQ